MASVPNPQKLEAIETTDGPVLIIAGPGSGKTFTLVERIVHLIQQKGDPEVSQPVTELTAWCMKKTEDSAGTFPKNEMLTTNR